MVRQIEEMATDTRDMPLTPITISDCGVLAPEESGEEDTRDPADPYEDYPDVISEEEKKPEMLLKIATRMNELGNEAIKTLLYDRSIQKYEKGLRYVAAHHAKDDDDPNITQELRALGIRLHLNSALAQLKTNQDAEVIKSTTRALGIDGISESEKAKAFYRRGRAYERGNEHELAVEDLKRALALNPNDSEVLAELNRAKHGLRMRQEMDKKTYSKLFS